MSKQRYKEKGRFMKKQCKVAYFLCEHDLGEREIAATTDGMCPICMKKKIEELEAKLALHDRSQYEMFNNKWLDMMQEKVNTMDMKINKMAEEKIHTLNWSFHWY